MPRLCGAERDGEAVRFVADSRRTRGVVFLAKLIYRTLAFLPLALFSLREPGFPRRWIGPNSGLFGVIFFHRVGARGSARRLDPPPPRNS